MSDLSSRHNLENAERREDAFRILMLGDFSGRKNRGVSGALAARKPMMVDRDNFDEVLEALHPELRLPGLTLEFSEIDDFHPDNIYRNSEKFRELAEERNRPVQTSRRTEVSSRGLLDQMMEDSGDESPSAAESTGDLADFLKKVVKPHLEPRADPRQQAHAASVDSAAAAAMRGVLHHPDFQALESAWRAVWTLVRGLDTDGDLKLYIADVALEEMARDPSGAERLFQSRERPWSVIVLNGVFGQTERDAKLLGSLGRMARAAGVPILAEATPPSESTSEAWSALRRSEEAHWIGLALPRFLLRLPYGKQTSPVESFDFDEMLQSVHQNHLWGNPAFCCAYLLGEAFLEDGWNMRAGSRRQMSGLPLHVYTEDGESQMKPCAEILMTESEAEFLMEQGIMPLASLKNQDAILLVRLQSIAEPVAALSGPWVA